MQLHFTSRLSHRMSMKTRYIILIVLLYLFLVDSSSMAAPDASSSTQPQEKSTSAIPTSSIIKSMQILSTIEFSSTSDMNILNYLQQLINKSYDACDVKISSPPSPIDIYTNAGGRVIALFNARKVDFINNQAMFSYAQSHIDGALTFSQESPKIVLAINKDDHIPFNLIDNFVKDIRSYANVFSRSAVDILVVEYDPSDATVAATTIFDEMKSLLDHSLITGGDDMFKAVVEQSKRNQYARDRFHSYIIPSSLESEATVISSSLVSVYITILQQKLSSSHPLVGRSISIPSSKDLADIMQATEDEVQQLIPLDLSANSSDSLLLASKSCFLGSVQLRIQIHHILQPYFKKSIDMLRASVLKDFESAVMKIKGSTRGFPSQLHTIAKNAASLYTAQAKAIQQVYIEAVEKKGSGLLSIRHHRGGPKGQGSKDGIPPEIQLDIHFLEASYKNIDHSINSLKQDMKDAIEERVRFLFLEGRYNPYIRTLPFPPVHLNLNYLVDPRSVMVNREYGALYDDHKEGIATNRADPLWIPGVSRIPFDPTQHPVPKDNKPWWEVLKDFVRNDM